MQEFYEKIKLQSDTFQILKFTPTWLEILFSIFCKLFSKPKETPQWMPLPLASSFEDKSIGYHR